MVSEQRLAFAKCLNLDRLASGSAVALLEGVAPVIQEIGWITTWGTPQVADFKTLMRHQVEIGREGQLSSEAGVSQRMPPHSVEEFRVLKPHAARSSPCTAAPPLRLLVPRSHCRATTATALPPLALLFISPHRVVSIAGTRAARTRRLSKPSRSWRLADQL